MFKRSRDPAASRHQDYVLPSPPAPPGDGTPARAPGQRLANGYVLPPIPIMDSDRLAELRARVPKTNPQPPSPTVDEPPLDEGPGGPAHDDAPVPPDAAPGSHPGEAAAEADGNAIPPATEAASSPAPVPSVATSMLKHAAEGSVVARLLVASPRFDGVLSDAVPPPGVVELALYLAATGGPVGADRLRTRTLGGTEDEPAALQTLRNNIAQAREYLGVDRAGQPLVPLAAPGMYRVSSDITTDLGRLLSLTSLAATSGGSEAIALARAALELIEAEPLSELPPRTRYDWFRTEGYEARAQHSASKAATVLGELAKAAGDLDLAEWGFAKATLLDPWNELPARPSRSDGAPSPAT